MDEKANSDPVIPDLSPDDVRRAFDAAEKKAAESQELHSQAAQTAGYTRDVLHVTGPFYAELARLAEGNPQLTRFVASGIRFAKSVEAELEETNTQGQPVPQGLYGLSNSAYVFCSTSGTASRALRTNPAVPPFVPPPAFAIDYPQVEAKLVRIDPALADTYREIGQAYHGTMADPSRAALSMMRQALDHLFGNLAPDEKVRASPYWKRKTGPKSELVTRHERLTYTAHTYIHDEPRAQTILANIDNVLETYEMLDNLHKRGELSDSEARTALLSMKTFIETWANAIEL